MAANITLRYNGSSVHIDGLDIRTKGSDFAYSLTSCGSLTRSGHRMATAKGQHATATEALAAAKSLASALGKKLCKTCTAAAEAMAATEVPAAPAARTTRKALGAASVTGWELLYDKPAQDCEVARRFDAQGKAQYALICKTTGTVHTLAKLSDERAARKANNWR